MQKLTILDPFNNPVRRIAKYNIGQKVYVIEWVGERYVLLEGRVLFVGITHPMQHDKITYIIDRDIKNDDRELYEESQVHRSRINAAKALQRKIRKDLKTLKVIIGADKT